MATTPHVVLLIETSRTYTRDLLHGIKQFISEHGPWSTFLELRALDSQFPPWLSKWRGDGILCRSSDQRMVNRIAKIGVPTVELRAWKMRHSLPFVGIDNRVVAQLVADHLVERGFRNFGCYLVESEPFFKERRDCFLESLAARGHACHCFRQPQSSERPSQWEEQQGKLIKWVKQLPKPVGVMACSDQLGFWLLDACGRSGIAVPEEVAVVGVEDDDALCGLATPPMSSVCYPALKVGYEAASLLARLMNGEVPPKSPLLIKPPGITVRSSSDVISIDDKLVAQALRFIREHIRQGILVDHVCAAANCSRSTLERRMERAIGRTPHEEILRVRLGLVCQLLTETDLSIMRIAERAGFAHPQYMMAMFREKFGQTPTQYRKSFRPQSTRTSVSP